jgi:hypothetical protein
MIVVHCFAPRIVLGLVIELWGGVKGGSETDENEDTNGCFLPHPGNR